MSLIKIYDLLIITGSLLAFLMGYIFSHLCDFVVVDI